MMETIIKLMDSLEVDKNLLYSCKIQLLTCDDIASLRKFISWQIETKIGIEYELIYEQLYIGQWNEVPEDFRRIFLILSFLKAFCKIRGEDNQNLDTLLKALHVLDVGIVIGSGLDKCQLLTKFAQQLHEYIVNLHPPELIVLTSSIKSSPDQCEIDLADQPSVEQFMTKHFNFHRPLKLLNCINHWPAMTKWKDMNYFMTIAGYRTVPIELGKKYDSDDWSQGMFRLGEFLKNFMSDNCANTQSAYLAQHDLFDQIPCLRNDFCVPDYCAMSSTDPVVKSWIGPGNTISTMHTDDKHNLLCQVMGEKLVILASPDDSNHLYPYEGLLNNTSQVDPENPNYDEFPLSKNVKFYKIILKAGETLYIPKLWHHYVRSLTPSISISFWFGAE